MTPKEFERLLLDVMGRNTVLHRAAAAAYTVDLLPAEIDALSRDLLTVRRELFAIIEVLDNPLFKKLDGRRRADYALFIVRECRKAQLL